MIDNHLSNASDASINNGEQAKIIYVQRSTAPEDWNILADPGFESPPTALTALLRPQHPLCRLLQLPVQPGYSFYSRLREYPLGKQHMNKCPRDPVQIPSLLLSPLLQLPSEQKQHLRTQVSHPRKRALVVLVLNTVLPVF